MAFVLDDRQKDFLQNWVDDKVQFYNAQIKRHENDRMRCKLYEGQIERLKFDSYENLLDLYLYNQMMERELIL